MKMLKYLKLNFQLYRRGSEFCSGEHERKTFLRFRELTTKESLHHLGSITILTNKEEKSLNSLQTIIIGSKLFYLSVRIQIETTFNPKFMIERNLSLTINISISYIYRYL